MEGIIDLHHDIMFFLILIVILVSFVMFDFIVGDFNVSNLSKMPYNNYSNFTKEKVVLESLLPKNIQHNTTLEIV